MTGRGLVFVEEGPNKDAPTTSSNAGAEASSSSNNNTAKNTEEFDIFEYLNDDAASQETLRDPILQRMTIVRYDGDLDAAGYLHGTGSLVSTLGYSYQGQLESGVMSGEGRIQWKNGIAYQGAFRDNLPWGKGRYQWPNGDWYEGEVVKSIRNGHGTFYSASQNITYTGDWKEGRRHGKGTIAYTVKSSYVGEWCEDQRQGSGTMTYESGDVYDGEWSADQRHGQGSMAWVQNGVIVELYKGEWRHGVQDGSGFSMYVRQPSAPPVAGTSTLTPVPPPLASAQQQQQPVNAKSIASYIPPKDAAVNTYTGEFRNGVRDGFGLFVYDDGSRYEGTWKDNRKHGEGKYTASCGAVSLDLYVDGTPVGPAGGSTSTPSLAEGSPTTTTNNNPGAASSSSASPIGVVVPLQIRDVLGSSENNIQEAVAAVQSMLSRHMGLLKKVFQFYSTLDQSVAVILTPSTWRRERTQGTMALIQLYRCLSDAKLINRQMTMARVARLLLALQDSPNQPHSVTNSPTPLRSADNSLTTSIGMSKNSSPRSGASSSRYSTPWADYAKSLYLFRGELSFRDFAEVLVRIAAEVYSDDAYGSLPSKVAVVLEEHLTLLSCTPRSGTPLFPSTRLYNDTIAKHLPLLQELFLQYSTEGMLASGTTATPAPPPAPVAPPTPAKKSAANVSQSINVSMCIPSSLQPTAPSLVGRVLTVRQYLLLLKHAHALDDEVYTLRKAMKQFPFEKFPSVTAAVREKRTVAHAVPIRDSSSSAASQSDSVAPPSHLLTETQYRTLQKIAKKSKGYNHEHIRETLQVELELTFVEFVEAVIQTATTRGTETEHTDRVNAFVKNVLAPLHKQKC